jgi:hypothetical protein
MPTESTTQLTFKTNLEAALDARPGLNGVQVTIGFPKVPAKELVMLGDIKGTQEPASIGRLSREERYKLEVTIKVERQGTDQSVPTTRAYAIAAELEQQLRDDPTVAGAVRIAQVGGRQHDPGRYDLEEFVTSDGAGRMAVLTIDVACEARLT